jgi:iron complex transport system ATP-binding protein
MSIDVKQLIFSYRKKQVLQDISFTLPRQSLMCVLGPNGVGKSTLFQCILGLLTKYSGQIRIDGEDVRGFSPSSLARRVAYVPQSHSPAFSYSVMEMVLMGTSSHFSVMSVPGKKERQLALDALEKVGIAGLSSRSFMHLSGGERQLVLIARALAQQARILIMDEPTANLDYGNQLRVLNSVKQLVQSGYTVIQSTHNPDQALLFADTVLALHNGRLYAYGEPHQVITEELLHTLYGIDIRLEELYEGKISICIPRFAIHDISSKS